MSITVTATQGGSTANGIQIRLMVLTGVAGNQNGATATQSAASGAHQATITTTVTGSRVYGAMVNGSGSATFTAASGNTIIDDVADTTNSEHYATCKTSAATGTPGATTVGATAPTNGGGGAWYEVLPAGTVTEDGSAPGVATVTNTTTVTTAAFTPPPGSLLVALVSADGGGAVTTMTVSGGGLTWTAKAQGNGSGNDYAGVWIASVPGGVPQVTRSRRIPLMALYRKRGRQFFQIPGLVRVPLTSGITGSAGTGNFTSSSFTPPNNCLLVVSGTFDENNGTTTDPTSVFVVSDSNSNTWTQQATATASPTSFPTCTKIWTAQITTGSSMTITLGTGGRSSLGYGISVVAYTGYNTTTPIGATATGQQNGGFGAAPNPISITLSGTPAASSEIVGAVGIDKDTSGGATQGTGWTKVHDVFNGTADLDLSTEVLTGTTSTNVPWVDLRPTGGNLFNYAAVAVEVLAFTPTVATAPAFPFVMVTQPRRVRGMQPRRAKPIQAVPPQFNPPFPFAEVVQPRRPRGMLLRRGKQEQTVPIPQEMPVPENVQPRRFRGLLLPRHHARPIEVVPPQFNPPYPFTEVTQPRRFRGLLPRRAKPIETVPPQQAAAGNPPYPPQTLRARVKSYLIDRGRISQYPVPPQFNPPYPWAEVVQPRRARGYLLRRGKQSQAVAPPQEQPVPEVVQPHRLRGLLPRRSKPIQTVPPQFNPPFPFSEIVQPRRLRGLLPRRAKPIEVVPSQITFTNPPFPWSVIAQIRKLRGYPVRRAKPIETVPPQFNPPYPFQEIVQPRRVRGLLPRRGRQAQPLPVQDGSIPEVAQPRRQRGWLFRRGKQAAPVPAQVILTPPVFPPNDITSRQKMQRLAPRGKVWQPPWPQSINPIPFRDSVWNFGHVSLRWALNIIQNSKWRSGHVETPKWLVGAIDRTKWLSGHSASRWTIGGVVVPNPDIPLSSLSLEYIRVPVTATANGLAINPTGDTVKMAFLQGVSTQPQVGDWKTASWDTPGNSGTYFAQCLVGPGGAITLTAGDWYVWIQITDNPEIPVRQVGVIKVV